MALPGAMRTTYEPLAHNTTRQLAEFVVRTRLEHLPAEVLQQARRCTIDCLGVSIGAADHPSVGILLQLAELLGGVGQATAWTTDRRLNLAQAALINGHLAHLLDFDDTFLSDLTTLHGNAPVVPAALALGEWLGASGADYLLALALGYEVSTRVALSAGQAHHRQRWHVTSTVGTNSNVFSSAATRSCCRRVNPGNIGNDRISVAASSVTGKLPR